MQMQLFREFESAWKLVAEGPPRVEDYLARLPLHEQFSARQALTQIEERFRPLFDARRPSGAPSRTVDLRPAPKAGVAEPPGPSSTVDESLGVVVGTGTVDESKGQPITDGVVKKTSGKHPVLPGYVILGELGRGGMGVVYKARHLALDRVVALKMILGGAQVDEGQLARFHTEAQAVARLQHPGVVQVFEISEHNGLPYFSLEYVDGGSLARKIDHEPQPPAEAACLVEGIALAIQAAHEKNIIHRDLKPANVLLTPDGSPKVTDFGLARRLEGDAGQTRAGSVLGSPSYMAPEQARGDVESVGRLADVYALGAILYEMLTGRPPFRGATILETLEQVEKQEPVPPAQLAPHTPKDLETICLKCLQKEPGKRYPSAGELATDLRRFQEGRPIVARPVSRAERLWRLCRRNPVVSSLTAALALVVVSAAVGGPVLAVAFKNQSDEREAARREEAIAKDRAVASQKEADVNTEGALAAMRFVVLRLKQLLRGKADFVQARKVLTAGIVTDLQKLSDNLKNRTVKDRSVAAAHGNLGEIYVELGEFSRSKRHFDAAEEIFARLLAEEPENAVARRNLANVLNWQGTVAGRLGESGNAVERFQKALQMRQEWQKMLAAEAGGERVPSPEEDRPTATRRDDYEAQIAVAQSYGLLGRTSLERGDPAAALGYYQQSKKQYDAVPDRHYTGSVDNLRLDYERERTHLKRQLGRCYLQLGRLAEARKHLATALDERVARAQKAGKGVSPSLRHDVVMSRIDMGDLELLHEGNPLAAIGYYRTAALSAEVLTKQEPDNVNFTIDFAGADYRMGYACMRAAMLRTAPASAGWVALSQLHFTRARRTMEKVATIDPADVRPQSLLMLCEVRTGHRSQALARIQRLLKQGPDDPKVLFSAACGYALASATGDSQKGDLDLALATLKKAVEHGWRDIERLRHDPDLDPLRTAGRLAALERQLADSTKR